MPTANQSPTQDTLRAIRKHLDNIVEKLRDALRSRGEDPSDAAFSPVFREIEKAHQLIDDALRQAASSAAGRDASKRFEDAIKRVYRHIDSVEAMVNT